jgi:hypothetical protein
MRNENIGSLAICPKHNRNWGDDGTTTRAGKWAAAAGGIDLKLPVRSMRAHRQARTRIIVYLAWTLVTFVIGIAALHWLGVI